jgi:hypothetical protein
MSNKECLLMALFSFMSSVLGLTFTIEFLESLERRWAALPVYEGLKLHYPAEVEELMRQPPHDPHYTALAYVFAVALLVSPFFFLQHAFVAISMTLLNAVLIILFFTFYLSVVKGYDFRRRFLEMVLISLGVAAVSFGIGYAVKNARQLPGIHEGLESDVSTHEMEEAHEPDLLLL